MIFMKKFAWLTCFLFPVLMNAQEVNIIPQPAEMNVGNGFYTISNRTQIAYDGNNKNAEGSAKFLADYLKRYCKLDCKLSGDIHGNDVILLMTTGKQDQEGF